MTTIRLLADDLTGALDTAAEFADLTGPVHAFWQGAPAGSLPPNAALDLGTRETTLAHARATVGKSAAALAGADIAFKKIDSLIRGHTVAELAACFAAGFWERCILAPAFPFQGRITRGGQQFAAAGNDWRPVGPNLIAALRAIGAPAQPGRPGQPLPPGITVFDAQTDADLDVLVAQVDAPVLWCGTGGLARALTGALASTTSPAPTLPRPILGLFGSDQQVTAAQLAACDPHWTALPNGDAHAAAQLSDALARHGVALASHAMPPGLARDEAAARIDRTFRALLGHLPIPGTLIAAGGETLRGLCLALAATSLEVIGRIMPGVPVSILRGGPWDGVTIVSKSGAFGHPTLLRDLIRAPELERTSA